MSKERSTVGPAYATLGDRGGAGRNGHHDVDEDYLQAVLADDGTPEAGDGAKETSSPRKSVATKLVELTEQRYVLGCTPDGEPYAVPKSGPRIVRLLRGGRQSLRGELAQAYYDATEMVPSQSALSDACTVLEGKAQRVAPVELYMRVAKHEGRLVLDLGDTTGRAVVIDSLGWRTVDEPPVLFRRTALTAALPTPASGAALADLWRLLNVREEYRPILAAVLVAELIPNIPHPVLVLAGEQGTAKTTTTKMIAAILDPSPVQVRKPPKDLDTWVTAAAGSWVVALDNLSSIPDWLSDALCRAVTGDGDVRRRLYTDGDLHVTAFRRAVIVNGVDLGAVRDDLADRLVTIALDRITDADRKPDEEIAEKWALAHPQVLGAVLDLAVRVLAVLPDVQLREMPRMADFARILAAVDQVQGTKGLRTYLGLRTELAEDALNSDPALAAIHEAITGEWTGTAAELLTEITPTPTDEKWRPPKGWPTKPRDLTTVLKRRAPSLRRLGWTVEQAGKDDRARAVRWRLTPPRQSRGGNDTRNARNARADTESAGQTPDEGASNIASDERGTASVPSDVARTPGFRSHDARTPDNALTSANTLPASVASVASDESGPPPHMRCRRCKQPSEHPLIASRCRACAYPTEEQDDQESA